MFSPILIQLVFWFERSKKSVELLNQAWIFHSAALASRMASLIRAGVRRKMAKLRYVNSFSLFDTNAAECGLFRSVIMECARQQRPLDLLFLCFN